MMKGVLTFEHIKKNLDSLPDEMVKSEMQGFCRLSDRYGKLCDDISDYLMGREAKDAMGVKKVVGNEFSRPLILVGGGSGNGDHSARSTVDDIPIRESR